MKILVTGGAGFIGSTLSDVLIARGDSVVVIDSFNDYYDPAIKRANVSALLTSPNFTLHEFDIRDGARVSEVMAAERPDVIVHIAARAGVRPSIDDPVLYEEVNGLGTLNIVEAAKGIGLKNFVFASSSSVYGLNSKVPFSESDPVTCPISPYAATKRANELMLYTYSHLYNIPVTCLRFFTVYGERGRPDMAIAKFTALIDEGHSIPVYGDGSAIRDFTYIGDIIDGVVGAIDTPHAYEIINIGGSKTVELRRVIEIIEEKLGKKAEIDFMDKFPGDVPVTSADVTKAREMIGFDPKVGIEEGIGRYIDWYLAGKEG
ncbi:MAG: GDP-mannose 4,6-dehydratase [Proteobacteria bacterium]|nr:GDP-mannose 4,6-dehydratase [Pseudomonadota bacterium]